MKDQNETRHSKGLDKITMVAALVLTVLCIISYLTSCGDKPKKETHWGQHHRIPIKPFYVYNKITGGPISTYWCVDSKGLRFPLEDYSTKYSVGDSIK